MYNIAVVWLHWMDLGKSMVTSGADKAQFSVKAQSIYVDL